MRYTEKLEALEFAISCIDQVHNDGAGDLFLGHVDDTSKCGCKHGVTIRRLQDEAETTRVSIDAMAMRKGKSSIKWGLRLKQTPEVQR